MADIVQNGDCIDDGDDDDDGVGCVMEELVAAPWLRVVPSACLGCWYNSAGLIVRGVVTMKFDETRCALLYVDGFVPDIVVVVVVVVVGVDDEKRRAGLSKGRRAAANLCID